MEVVVLGVTNPDKEENSVNNCYFTDQPTISVLDRPWCGRTSSRRVFSEVLSLVSAEKTLWLNVWSRTSRELLIETDYALHASGILSGTESLIFISHSLSNPFAFVILRGPASFDFDYGEVVITYSWRSHLYFKCQRKLHTRLCLNLTYLGWNEGRKRSACDEAHLDDYQCLSAQFVFNCPLSICNPFLASIRTLMEWPDEMRRVGSAMIDSPKDLRSQSSIPKASLTIDAKPNAVLDFNNIHILD
jgi:hypothetical protein